MDTTRYVMTDDDARTAYVQDWHVDTEGNADVTEVHDLDVADADTLEHDEWHDAVVRAAEAAGYVLPAWWEDNSDVGRAYEVGPVEEVDA